MEPFKNLINVGTVIDIAHHLARVSPAFDRSRFETLAGTGLDALEFKARAEHVCAALQASLPLDFPRAAEALVASLGSPDGDHGTPATSAAGLAGWAVWPLTSFIARNGLDAPMIALPALHAMTQRFTAEFAIRPFIAQHPQLTFEHLHRWVHDPSPHVRRLVSEGSRPRLPWGLRLQALVNDPRPTLPLLEALQDDPSEYVRRSVANHLNDIAKDHPAVVADWLRRYLPDASPERRSLLQHASRTLVKLGDRAVLAAFGFDAPLRGSASLSIEPKVAKIGGAVDLVVELRSTARTEQNLVVDYVVHRVLADGSTSPKVWKGWRLRLSPRQSKGLRKHHSLQKVTVRTDRPGNHSVELLVNGRVVASSAFELRRPSEQGRAGRK